MTDDKKPPPLPPWYGQVDCETEDRLLAQQAAAWRPPAMTEDCSPLPCPECRASKHGNCDGSSWSEADDRLADCPCPDLTHRQGTMTVELTHRPADDEYPETVEEPDSYLPPRCRCVIVFAHGTAMSRLSHPDCPVPETDHHDNDWKDTR